MTGRGAQVVVVVVVVVHLLLHVGPLVKAGWRQGVLSPAALTLTGTASAGIMKEVSANMFPVLGGCLTRLTSAVVVPGLAHHI
jgi:hypothetical protein